MKQQWCNGKRKANFLRYIKWHVEKDKSNPQSYYEGKQTAFADTNKITRKT